MLAACGNDFPPRKLSTVWRSSSEKEAKKQAVRFQELADAELDIHSDYRK
jgi:hypothetical protein